MAVIDVKVNLDTREAMESATALNEAISGKKDASGATIIDGKVNELNKLGAGFAAATGSINGSNPLYGDFLSVFTTANSAITQMKQSLDGISKLISSNTLTNGMTEMFQSVYQTISSSMEIYSSKLKKMSEQGFSDLSKFQEKGMLQDLKLASMTGLRAASDATTLKELLTKTDKNSIPAVFSSKEIATMLPALRMVTEKRIQEYQNAYKGSGNLENLATQLAKDDTFEKAIRGSIPKAKLNDQIKMNIAKASILANSRLKIDDKGVFASEVGLSSVAPKYIKDIFPEEYRDAWDYYGKIKPNKYDTGKTGASAFNGAYNQKTYEAFRNLVKSGNMQATKLGMQVGLVRANEGYYEFAGAPTKAQFDVLAGLAMQSIVDAKTSLPFYRVNRNDPDAEEKLLSRQNKIFEGSMEIIDVLKKNKSIRPNVYSGAVGISKNGLIEDVIANSPSLKFTEDSSGLYSSDKVKIKTLGNADMFVIPQTTLDENGKLIYRDYKTYRKTNGVQTKAEDEFVTIGSSALTSMLGLKGNNTYGFGKDDEGNPIYDTPRILRLNFSDIFERVKDEDTGKMIHRVKQGPNGVTEKYEQLAKLYNDIGNRKRTLTYGAPGDEAEYIAAYGDSENATITMILKSHKDKNVKTYDQIVKEAAEEGIANPFDNLEVLSPEKYSQQMKSMDVARKKATPGRLYQELGYKQNPQNALVDFQGLMKYSGFKDADSFMRLSNLLDGAAIYDPSVLNTNAQMRTGIVAKYMGTPFDWREFLTGSNLLSLAYASKKNRGLIDKSTTNPSGYSFYMPQIGLGDKGIKEKVDEANRLAGLIGKGGTPDQISKWTSQLNDLREKYFFDVMNPAYQALQTDSTVKGMGQYRIMTAEQFDIQKNKIHAGDKTWAAPAKINSEGFYELTAKQQADYFNQVQNKYGLWVNKTAHDFRSDKDFIPESVATALHLNDFEISKKSAENYEKVLSRLRAGYGGDENARIDVLRQTSLGRQLIEQGAVDGKLAQMLIGAEIKKYEQHRDKKEYYVPDEGIEHRLTAPKLTTPLAQTFKNLFNVTAEGDYRALTHYDGDTNKIIMKTQKDAIAANAAAAKMVLGRYPSVIGEYGVAENIGDYEAIRLAAQRLGMNLDESIYTDPELQFTFMTGDYDGDTAWIARNLNAKQMDLITDWKKKLDKGRQEAKNRGLLNASKSKDKPINPDIGITDAVLARENSKEAMATGSAAIRNVTEGYDLNDINSWITLAQAIDYYDRATSEGFKLGEEIRLPKLVSEAASQGALFRRFVNQIYAFSNEDENAHPSIFTTRMPLQNERREIADIATGFLRRRQGENVGDTFAASLNQWMSENFDPETGRGQASAQYAKMMTNMIGGYRLANQTDINKARDIGFGWHNELAIREKAKEDVSEEWKEWSSYMHRLDQLEKQGLTKENNQKMIKGLNERRKQLLGKTDADSIEKLKEIDAELIYRNQLDKDPAQILNQINEQWDAEAETRKQVVQDRIEASKKARFKEDEEAFYQKHHGYIERITGADVRNRIRMNWSDVTPWMYEQTEKDKFAGLQNVSSENLITGQTNGSLQDVRFNPYPHEGYKIEQQKFKVMARELDLVHGKNAVVPYYEESAAAILGSMRHASFEDYLLERMKGNKVDINDIFTKRLMGGTNDEEHNISKLDLKVSKIENGKFVLTGNDADAKGQIEAGVNAALGSFNEKTGKYTGGTLDAFINNVVEKTLSSGGRIANVEGINYLQNGEAMNSKEAPKGGRGVRINFDHLKWTDSSGRVHEGYEGTFAPDLVLSNGAMGSKGETFTMYDYKSSELGAFDSLYQMAVYAKDMQKRATEWKNAAPSDQARLKQYAEDKGWTQYVDDKGNLKIKEFIAYDTGTGMMYKANFTQADIDKINSYYELAQKAKLNDAGGASATADLANSAYMKHGLSIIKEALGDRFDEVVSSEKKKSNAVQQGLYSGKLLSSGTDTYRSYLAQKMIKDEEELGEINSFLNREQRKHSNVASNGYSRYQIMRDKLSEMLDEDTLEKLREEAKDDVSAQHELHRMLEQRRKLKDKLTQEEQVAVVEDFKDIRNDLPKLIYGTKDNDYINAVTGTLTKFQNAAAIRAGMLANPEYQDADGNLKPEIQAKITESINEENKARSSFEKMLPDLAERQIKSNNLSLDHLIPSTGPTLESSIQNYYSNRYDKLQTYITQQEEDIRKYQQELDKTVEGTNDKYYAEGSQERTQFERLLQNAQENKKKAEDYRRTGLKNEADRVGAAAFNSYDFNNQAKTDQLMRSVQSNRINQLGLGRTFIGRTIIARNQQLTGLENTQNSLLKEIASQEELLSKTEKGSDAYNTISNNLEKLRSASESTQSQINLMSGSFGTANAIAGQFSQSINRVFSMFGRRIFMRVANETMQFVKQFDASMNQIQMITLKSDSEISKLGDSLIDKAKELKVSVSEISQSAATLYRQGLSDTEVDERLEVVSKFSKVSGTKVDAATKLITVAMNTGLVKQTEEASDIVTALGDNAATNAAEIEKGIEKAGAAAAADGTTFAQLASMLTAITSTTQIGGNVAGRTLNTIFGRMNKIGTNELIYDENGNAISGSAVAKLLESEGIKMYDENGNKRSTYDTLYALSQKWDSLSDAKQQQFANAIAGTRQYSNFAAIMTGMSEGKVDEYMQLAGESSGITDKKYEIYTKSLNASLTDLRNTWDGLVNDMTDKGALTGFIGVLTNAIQGVDNLADHIGGVGAALAGIVPTAMLLMGMKSGTLLGAAVAGLGALAVWGISEFGKNTRDVTKERDNAYAEIDKTFNTRNENLNKLKDLNSKGNNRTDEETTQMEALLRNMSVSLNFSEEDTKKLLESKNKQQIDNLIQQSETKNINDRIKSFSLKAATINAAAEKEIKDAQKAYENSAENYDTKNLRTIFGIDTDEEFNGDYFSNATLGARGAGLFGDVQGVTKGAISDLLKNAREAGRFNNENEFGEYANYTDEQWGFFADQLFNDGARGTDPEIMDKIAKTLKQYWLDTGANGQGKDNIIQSLISRYKADISEIDSTLNDEELTALATKAANDYYEGRGTGKTYFSAIKDIFRMDQLDLSPSEREKAIKMALIDAGIVTPRQKKLNELNLEDVGETGYYIDLSKTPDQEGYYLSQDEAIRQVENYKKQKDFDTTRYNVYDLDTADKITHFNAQDYGSKKAAEEAANSIQRWGVRHPDGTIEYTDENGKEFEHMAEARRYAIQWDKENGEWIVDVSSVSPEIGGSLSSYNRKTEQIKATSKQAAVDAAWKEYTNLLNNRYGLILDSSIAKPFDINYGTTEEAYHALNVFNETEKQNAELRATAAQMKQDAAMRAWFTDNTTGKRYEAKGKYQVAGLYNTQKLAVDELMKKHGVSDVSELFGYVDENGNTIMGTLDELNSQFAQSDYYQTQITNLKAVISDINDQIETQEKAYLDAESRLSETYQFTTPAGKTVSRTVNGNNPEAVLAKGEQTINKVRDTFLMQNPYALFYSQDWGMNKAGDFYGYTTNPDEYLNSVLIPTGNGGYRKQPQSAADEIMNKVISSGLWGIYKEGEEAPIQYFTDKFAVGEAYRALLDARDDSDYAKTRILQAAGTSVNNYGLSTMLGKVTDENNNVLVDDRGITEAGKNFLIKKPQILAEFADAGLGKNPYSWKQIESIDNNSARDSLMQYLGMSYLYNEVASVTKTTNATSLRTLDNQLSQMDEITTKIDELISERRSVGKDLALNEDAYIDALKVQDNYFNVGIDENGRVYGYGGNLGGDEKTLIESVEKNEPIQIEYAGPRHARMFDRNPQIGNARLLSSSETVQRRLGSEQTNENVVKDLVKPQLKAVKDYFLSNATSSYTSWLTDSKNSYAGTVDNMIRLIQSNGIMNESNPVQALLRYINNNGIKEWDSLYSNTEFGRIMSQVKRNKWGTITSMPSDMMEQIMTFLLSQSRDYASISVTDMEKASAARRAFYGLQGLDEKGNDLVVGRWKKQRDEFEASLVDIAGNPLPDDIKNKVLAQYDASHKNKDNRWYVSQEARNNDIEDIYNIEVKEPWQKQEDKFAKTLTEMDGTLGRKLTDQEREYIIKQHAQANPLKSIDEYGDEIFGTGYLTSLDDSYLQEILGTELAARTKLARETGENLSAEREELAYKLLDNAQYGIKGLTDRDKYLKQQEYIKKTPQELADLWAKQADVVNMYMEGFSGAQLLRELLPLAVSGNLGDRQAEYDNLMVQWQNSLDEQQRKYDFKYSNDKNASKLLQNYTTLLEGTMTERIAAFAPYASQAKEIQNAQFGLTNGPVTSADRKALASLVGLSDEDIRSMSRSDTGKNKLQDLLKEKSLKLVEEFAKSFNVTIDANIGQNLRDAVAARAPELLDTVDSLLDSLEGLFGDAQGKLHAEGVKAASQVDFGNMYEDALEGVRSAPNDYRTALWYTQNLNAINSLIGQNTYFDEEAYNQAVNEYNERQAAEIKAGKPQAYRTRGEDVINRDDFIIPHTRSTAISKIATDLGLNPDLVNEQFWTTERATLQAAVDAGFINDAEFDKYMKQTATGAKTGDNYDNIFKNKLFEGIFDENGVINENANLNDIVKILETNAQNQTGEGQAKASLATMLLSRDSELLDLVGRIYSGEVNDKNNKDEIKAYNKKANEKNIKEKYKNTQDKSDNLEKMLTLLATGNPIDYYAAQGLFKEDLTAASDASAYANRAKKKDGTWKSGKEIDSKTLSDILSLTGLKNTKENRELIKGYSGTQIGNILGEKERQALASANVDFHEKMREELGEEVYKNLDQTKFNVSKENGLDMQDALYDAYIKAGFDEEEAKAKAEEVNKNVSSVVSPYLQKGKLSWEYQYSQEQKEEQKAEIARQRAYAQRHPSLINTGSLIKQKPTIVQQEEPEQKPQTPQISGPVSEDFIKQAIQKAITETTNVVTSSLFGGQIGVGATAAPSIFTLTSGDSKDTSGNRGGGQPAWMKKLQEMEQKIKEFDHRVKLAQLKQEYYGNQNDYSKQIKWIRSETRAYAQLEKQLKKNIKELEEERKKVSKDSQEYKKLTEAIQQYEVKLQETINARQKMIEKRMAITEEKQDWRDTQEGHVRTMHDTYLARAQKLYQSGIDVTQEQAFGQYTAGIQTSMGDIRTQINTNNAQIAQWQKLLKKTKKDSDQYREIQKKIWAIQEENAQLENDFLDKQIELAEANLAQIATVLNNKLATYNHANNMAEVRANIAQIGQDYEGYRSAIREQQYGLYDQRYYYSQAIAATQKEMESYVAGSPEWLKAQEQLFNLQETAAKLDLTFLQLNKTISESYLNEVLTKIDKSYTNATLLTSLAEGRTQRAQINGDYDLIPALLKEEQDALINQREVKIKAFNDLRDLIFPDGEIDFGKITDKNVADEDLKQLKSTIQEIDQLTTSIDQKTIDIQKARLAVIDERYERQSDWTSHRLDMLGYEETKYKNKGELRNYGLALNEEQVKTQTKLLLAQEALIQAQNEYNSYQDKSTTGALAAAESVQKYEKEVAELTNKIEDNTESLKENEQAIRQARATAEESADKWIKAIIQKEKDMTSGTVSLQKTLLDAIRKRYEAEWEIIQKDIDKKKEALNDEKNLINERIRARKNAENQDLENTKLSELQKQLTLIEADPTRSKEAKALRKQIEEMQKSMATTKAENLANAEIERLNDADKAYEDYKKRYQLEQQEILKYDSNFKEYLAGFLNNSDNFESFLEEVLKSEEYKGYTAEETKNLRNELWDTWKKSFGLIETYWDEINPYLMSQAEYDEATTKDQIKARDEKIAQNREKYLDKMRQTDEYLGASDTQKKMLEYSYGEEYDKYIATLIKTHGGVDYDENIKNEIITQDFLRTLLADQDALTIDNYKTAMIDALDVFAKTFGDDLKINILPEVLSSITSDVGTVTDKQKAISKTSEEIEKITGNISGFDEQVAQNITKWFDKQEAQKASKDLIDLLTVMDASDESGDRLKQAKDRYSRLTDSQKELLSDEAKNLYATADERRGYALYLKKRQDYLDRKQKRRDELISQGYSVEVIDELGLDNPDLTEEEFESKISPSGLGPTDSLKEGGKIPEVIRDDTDTGKSAAQESEPVVPKIGPTTPEIIMEDPGSGGSAIQENKEVTNTIDKDSWNSLYTSAKKYVNDSKYATLDDLKTWNKTKSNENVLKFFKVIVLGWDAKGLDTKDLKMSGVSDYVRSVIKTGKTYQNDKLQKDTYKKGRTFGFDEGGLVDFTGPAYVHGTLAKPEAFLDYIDTKNIRDLADELRLINLSQTQTHFSDSMFRNNSVSIGDLNVNLYEAKLESDADYETIAHKVGAAFTKELQKSGFNLASYSF